MLELTILAPALINGAMTGAVYALIALGLTLVFGVLHIINFAHGSLLMIAMYGVFFLNRYLGLDPYLAIPLMTAVMFVLGFVLQKSVISRASHGRDEMILLVTLGISLIIENLALYLWSADTRNLQLSYGFAVVNLGVALVSRTRLIAFVAAVVLCALLWLLIGRTDLGKAIRAVAREKRGARVVGIDVEHIYAMSFGIGVACLGAAACLLLPIYYVNPQVGNVFVLVAFTIVVLGGMGSFVGAFAGGIIIGIAESLGGLFLGESLGQIGIFLIFIGILLFRPTGLFRARA
jgi:branched-chain amino acid transport system permease protein